MITIQDLTYRIAGRPLLEGASAVIDRGQKIGLVGANGTGKSTLLRLIQGALAPDQGSITVPRRWRVGGVAQHAPAGAEPVLAWVLATDQERAALLHEAETSTDSHRLAEIHDRLTDIGAHGAEARAAQVLHGLGFDADSQARACAEFSGGMRVRIGLAAALFQAPDLLLLDEPTNHLDLESALWLEGYLARYPHTLILVSHERGLLNRSVDGILHLENRVLTRYAGGYDRFARTRAARLQTEAARAAQVDKQRRHMQAFVDRFRYKASKARQAQSRLKMLEKLEATGPVVESAWAAFDFPSPDALPPPLIHLDGVSVGYDGRPVLKDVAFRIDQDDRIALLGANGNGKSTLAKLVSGRLQPLSGTVTRARNLRVGYFAQHQTEELDDTLTAAQQAQLWMPKALPEAVRSHLGRFGFTQDRALTPIAGLSGGEKARLLLALVTRDKPHILVLDEPTNHLDIDSRDSLIAALNAYGGAVILITHDPHLVELTADRLWLVADGTCQPYHDDLDAYKRLLAASARPGKPTPKSNGAGGAKPAAAAGKEDAKARRQDAAQKRQSLAPLRKTVARHEKAMETLAGQKARLEADLADPALYQGPPDAVTDLRMRLKAVETDLIAAEAAWMEAAEALEAAQTAE